MNLPIVRSAIWIRGAMKGSAHIFQVLHARGAYLHFVHIDFKRNHMRDRGTKGRRASCELSHHAARALAKAKGAWAFLPAIRAHALG
jgi:hypothetical protein